MSKPSIVKQSRREGYALHPKALKAMVKRTSLPGMQGGRNQRGKASRALIVVRDLSRRIVAAAGIARDHFGAPASSCVYGTRKRD